MPAGLEISYTVALVSITMTKAEVRVGGTSHPLAGRDAQHEAAPVPERQGRRKPTLVQVVAYNCTVSALVCHTTASSQVSMS